MTTIDVVLTKKRRTTIDISVCPHQNKSAAIGV